VTSATCFTEPADDNTSSALRTIAPLILMFSASDVWRSHVLMNTWVGRSPGKVVRSDAASSRSAATGTTPSISRGGRRANPYTCQPPSRRCRARLLPTMPLAPITSADPVMA
jgi:hypothetical protein